MNMVARENRRSFEVEFNFLMLRCCVVQRNECVLERYSSVLRARAGAAGTHICMHRVSSTNARASQPWKDNM